MVAFRTKSGRRMAFRKRSGRCYELAWIALSRAPDPDAWVLVHGEANGPKGSRVDHAWLEQGSVIFDPVLDATMPRERCQRVCGASDGTRYKLKEAARQLLDEGHYGPWDGTP